MRRLAADAVDADLLDSRLGLRPGFVS